MFFKRLALILSVLIVCSAALTACGGTTTGNNSQEQKKSLTAQEDKNAQQKNKLEIFSWWTEGGESDGLNKMFELFKKKIPNVEIVNATVAGGAGSNGKQVLKNRMLAGDPPDSFQVHAGKEISTWVDAGKMEPIDDIYASEGWEKIFPKDVLDILKVNGHYYTVPVNIHRSNVLWYNKKVFEQYNLSVPKTFSEFITVAKILKSKGIVPLALGDSGQWVDVHVFESVLLSFFGPDGYNGLWNGKTDWNDPKLAKALETFAAILDYVNTDHSKLTWDTAAQLVVEGKAAMTIMGDWAEGYFRTKSFTDYGWTTSPGTEGTFLMLSDSFGMPKGCKNKDSAVAWLKLCGSLDAQEAFNPLKGSIPVRTDGGKAEYSEYLKSAMKDWSINKICPSVAHGAAAPEAWLNEIVTIVGDFVNTKNVQEAQKSLVNAKK